MRFPKKLRLRQGLHRRGHLTIINSIDGGWVVDWDAQIVGRVGQEESYVMDRSVLTTKQILDWTGFDPTK